MFALSIDKVSSISVGEHMEISIRKRKNHIKQFLLATIFYPMLSSNENTSKWKTCTLLFGSDGKVNRVCAKFEECWMLIG